MPIYQISTSGEDNASPDKQRLVKAPSASAAIAHCANQQFTAKLVTKVEDAAPLFAAGVKLETAGEAPASSE